MKALTGRFTGKIVRSTAFLVTIRLLTLFNRKNIGVNGFFVSMKEFQPGENCGDIGFVCRYKRVNCV